MPVLLISLNGGTPTMRTVQQRTAKLTAGVLCEVWADERMQLCIVDRINVDGSITARVLPAAADGASPTTPQRR
jgi:hypothetical protein